MAAHSLVMAGVRQPAAQTPRCMQGGAEAGSCARRVVSARQKRTASGGMAKVLGVSRVRGATSDADLLLLHILERLEAFLYQDCPINEPVPMADLIHNPGPWCIP